VLVSHVGEATKGPASPTRVPLRLCRVVHRRMRPRIASRNRNARVQDVRSVAALHAMLQSLPTPAGRQQLLPGTFPQGAREERRPLSFLAQGLMDAQKPVEMISPT